MIFTLPIQIPDLPPGVNKLDIYVGIALTLFVVDRVFYMINTRMGTKPVKNTSNGGGVTLPGWLETARKINEMYEWLSQEDPDTGIKVWRVSASELRRLEKTLEKLSKAIDENSRIMSIVYKRLGEQEFDRRA